ncbi:hypothetical protein QCM77_41785 [Bradyrhizobium sp. SSUT18]|uniref:hypothetical protein n=1 Tax=Bradyrhizobium sp. SSUT18 TaxID=3040602 RepID=UPI00244A249A|nr:hypothetical protein [Bradyrhizobium sp. SSUT18]MDH2406360.1 hypothetical protein [Bradyrhizobium sp. SSUT18]
MVIVNLPGGGVQEVGETELLWLRKAFDSEWKGATMLRLVADRIYSAEKVSDLVDKFQAAKVRLAEFAAPDVKVKIVVSAERVRQVTEGNPEIYHEQAKSILDFGGRVFLAVREAPNDARQKLRDAKAVTS